MRYNSAALAVFLLASGCSASSVTLLRQGDAKVCGKSDITREVANIIRSYVSNIAGSNLISDYPEKRDRYLRGVDFQFTNTTSVDVDTENQVISCKSDIILDKAPDSPIQGVEYQVAVDQSKDDIKVGARNYEILVSRLASLLADELKSEIVSATEASDERVKAEALPYEAEWRRTHAQEVSEMERVLADSKDYSSFSDEDRSLMLRAAEAKNQCGLDPYPHRFACPLMAALNRELEVKSLCASSTQFARANPPGSPFRCPD